MSSGDILRLMKMYSCDKLKFGFNETSTETFVESFNNEISSESQFIENINVNDKDLTSHKSYMIHSNNTMKQLDELYSNFELWPSAIVPYEIDSAFSKLN